MSTELIDPTEVELERSCHDQELPFFCDAACGCVANLRFALSYFFVLCGVRYYEVCARKAYRQNVLPRFNLTAPRGSVGAMAGHELGRLFVIRGILGPFKPHEADDFLDTTSVSEAATTPTTSIEFAAFFHQYYHGPTHGWEAAAVALHLNENGTDLVKRYIAVENVIPSEGHHLALYRLLDRVPVDSQIDLTREATNRPIFKPM